MVKVSLVKGIVRYDIVFKALQQLKKDLEEKLSSSSRIVIKPDLLHLNGCRDMELSNIDTVRAVLDFIEESTNKRITIAEGSFAEEDVFHKHGFSDLLHDYSIRFLRLQNDDMLPVKIGKSEVNVSKAILESDLRISVAVFKRDRRMKLLGSIPSMVLGSISDNNKDSFYKSRDAARHTAEILKLVNPHIAIIDGFDAPMTERKIRDSFAIVSPDAIAADTLAARLLKVKPLYLSHCPARKVTLVS